MGAICILSACGKPNNAQQWLIGKDKPKSKVLLEADTPKKIRFCSDQYSHISFPLTLHVIYDDNKYYGLLEGACITVQAKFLKVKFANPSSGKMARGTFEVLE
jgi:hypothetical protein